MVSEVLGRGAAESKTARELATYFDMSIRDVVKQIRNERLAGEPICASEKGYFLPASPDDLKATVNCLFLKSNETRRVAEAMQELL